MTIQQAIDKADMMKPNLQQTELKVSWLSELDGIIWKELKMTHWPAPTPGQRPPWETEDGGIDPYWREREDWTPPEPETFNGYTMEEDMDTELLAPFPYDEVYIYWIMSKIDLQNLELDKYQNDKTLFNNAYQTLADWWNRSHMPKQAGREFII